MNTNNQTAEAYMKAAEALHLAKDATNTSRSGYSINPWALTTADAEANLNIVDRVIAQKEQELEALKDARIDYLVQVKLGGPDAYREHAQAQA